MATSQKRSTKLTANQLEKLVAKAGGFEQMTTNEVLDLVGKSGWSIKEFQELFAPEIEEPTALSGQSTTDHIKPSKGFNAAKGSGSVKYEIRVNDVDSEEEPNENDVLIVAYLPPSIARRDVEVLVTIDPDSPKVNITKVS